MEISGPERFRLTFDAKKCATRFSGRANTSLPKLYVVVANGELIYVGITRQKMRQRFYGGWNAIGKNGYHGYAWRHTYTQADLYVWFHDDAPTDSMKELETVEAEVVFLIRCAGQWPRGQTEIHFHPSEKEHRDLAAKIVKLIGVTSEMSAAAH